MSSTEHLPDFICIGGFKCATTWLHDTLAEHPDVFLPDLKEVHFFDRASGEELYDSEMRNWYDDLYAPAPDGTVCGSVTPGYLTNREAAHGIRELLPDAKLAALLRNPIERAHSHYHYVDGRHGGLEFSFDQYIDHPDRWDEEILWRGEYTDYVEFYQETFPEDQLLFLQFDRIKEDSAALYREVCEFIDVDPEFVPETLNEKSNAARTIKNPAVYFFKQKVAKLLSHGGLDPVRRAIKKMGIPDLIRGFNQQPMEKPPLTDEQREKLVEYYREDVRKMEKLLGWELEHWLEA